jgi:hypothetical protein
MPVAVPHIVAAGERHIAVEEAGRTVVAAEEAAHSVAAAGMKVSTTLAAE